VSQTPSGGRVRASASCVHFGPSESLCPFAGGITTSAVVGVNGALMALYTSCFVAVMVLGVPAGVDAALGGKPAVHHAGHKERAAHHKARQDAREHMEHTPSIKT
jgi:hypothetical protein